MFKYFIDIFCKDTVIGLSQFDTLKPKRLYKNKYSPLFKQQKKKKNSFKSKSMYLDFAY